ncbi:hypothetical protein [Flavobacterium suaedae]|uniref:hypothetical protein n=1 Tax=Flavobacterium suaedae TaxID=1767027 RepID=UPI00166787A3|nr:hypothetical protein [Flavobacterium suaedae]
MKSFLKLFTFLFIAEIALGMLGVFLTQGVYVNFLNTIGYYLMLIISLPISLIDRSYPFYAPVPLFTALALVAINVFIHTLLFRLIFKKK